MLPETTIIKLFLNSSVYQKYKDSVDASVFPKELQGIYRVLTSFHDSHPDTDISLDDLANLFFATNPKDREFYIGVFDNLRTIVASEETCAELIRGIRQSKVLRELSLLSYEVAEGRQPYEKLQTLVHELQSPTVSDDDTEDVEFVTTDLDQLIEKTYSKPGLRWRLNTLNRILGSLRVGNFGFLFSRPETGKTTFLASECSHMLTQLADDAGPIIWLNNEEVGENVMLRVYQATFGATLVEIMQDRRNYARMFNEITKGKFLMVDRASISAKFVEKLCAKYKPSLLIFDQIDKIEGFANDRNDLRLGEIYRWARELAKQYCPVIAVCQADGTGEGQRWLTMANVAESKTTKQAEADWILGIGKVHDMGYENIRYLNVSKNKLVGDEDSDPTARHAKKEVLIRPDIARYVDIEG